MTSSSDQRDSTSDSDDGPRYDDRPRRCPPCKPEGGPPDPEALLEECSSHWGYEDPGYRLYHKSCKVYSLQAKTTTIVGALRTLAPERQLDEWFRRILSDGTGRSSRWSTMSDGLKRPAP